MASPIFNIIIGRRLSGKKTRASDIVKDINPDGVYTVTNFGGDYPASLNEGEHGHHHLEFAKVMAHLNATMKSPLLYMAIGFPTFTDDFWATLTSLKCWIPNLNIIMVAQCMPPYIQVCDWLPLPVTGVDYSGDDMMEHRKRVWEGFYQKFVTWAEFEVTLSNKSRYDFLHTDCRGNLSIHTTVSEHEGCKTLDQLHQIVVQLTQIVKSLNKK